MPRKIETDDVTGTETTGHEWDGIKELNTPLPRWWVYTFYACIAWSFGYFVFYPAIPGLAGHTEGLLGYTARKEIAAVMQAGDPRTKAQLERIRAATIADIQSDPQLLRVALAGGRAAFGDNCAPCHGLGGAGQKGGYPALADDDWLWGGTIEDIRFTIVHGVRNPTDKARSSLMPSFGDGALSRAQIGDVADFVLSLSGKAGRASADAVARGRTVFAENCAACHGEDGRGMQDQGAPDLADAIWLHGGTRADIMRQVTKPRMGVMGAWGQRLDEETVKMLTLYVHSLGGGQ